MDYAIENNIRDIFSESQCEVIGIQEAVYDIYSKGPDGKKVLDKDKVNKEFERIKNTPNATYASVGNQVKHLVAEIVGWTETISGGYNFGTGVGMALTGVTVGPIIMAAAAADGIIGYTLLHYAPAKNKNQDLLWYRDKLTSVNKKLTSIKAKSKNENDIKKIDEQISSIEKTIKNINNELKN